MFAELRCRGDVGPSWYARDGSPQQFNAPKMHDRGHLNSQRQLERKSSKHFAEARNRLSACDNPEKCD
jgi:hypothetical protein